MSLVKTERFGATFLIQLNRPERMNALGLELRTQMAEAFCELRDDKDLEVGILTGSGRAFCAGEDMKESIDAGGPGFTGKAPEDPYMSGTLDKPVIAAVNG